MCRLADGLIVHVFFSNSLPSEKIVHGFSGGSVFDQPVDVMLRPMLARGHLEDVRHAQQRLQGIPVGHHL